MKHAWKTKWRPPLPVLVWLAASTALTAQPVNDNFADRVILSGPRVTTTGTTVGATREPAEPLVAYANGPFYAHTVWWSWTAPGDGLLVVAIEGSAVVNVYSGASLSELGLASICLDFLGCRTARTQVSAGVAYHIGVASFPGINGDVLLNLAFIERPPNDDFTGRIHLGSSNVSVIVTNAAAATWDPGDNSPAILSPEKTLWWSWTAPASGPVTVGVEHGPFNPDARVFDPYASGSVWLSILVGDNLATATPVTNRANEFLAPIVPASSRVTFQAEAGTTYVIATDGYVDLFSSVTLRIAGTKRPRVILTYPPNDAEFTAGDPLKVAAEALDPDGEISAVDFFLDDSFRADGTVQRDQGRPFGGSWTNVPPGEYELFARAIDNLGATADAFPIRLTVRPVNDAFARRIGFTGSFVTVTGTLAAASSEPGEPPETRAGSVWWEWTAPASGKFTISANSYTLAVFDGASLSNLTLIATGAPGSTLRVVITAEAGRVYPIALGGTDYSRPSVQLSVAPTAPPTVAITSPTPNSSFVAGEAITFSATATDEDGSVRRVDFALDNNQWIGSVTNTPFNLVYTPVHDFRWYVRGWHVRAWATDDSGNVTPSESVPFAVQSPRPTNDDFANRIALTGSFVSATVSAAQATYEPGEESWVREGSVWWEWTAPESGWVTITVRSEFYYWPSLAVFTGTNLADLYLITNTAVATGNIKYEARVVINAQAGVTYPIAAGREEEITLSIARTLPPSISIISPTNGSVYVPGETINLVVDASDPDGTISRVEFYKYGSRWLGVVTNSPFVLPIIETNTFEYRVRAWATDNHGIRTPSDEVWFLVRFPHDDFANRIPFTGSFVSVTGSIAYATSEPDEPNFVPRNAAWWAWTAPESGDFTITASPHVSLAVFTGTNLAGLDLLARGYYSAGDPSQLTRAIIHAEAGVTYPIAVSGADDVVLSIAESLPPEVWLTSPEWNATFRAGDPVTFSASASDTDGTVRSVAFVLNDGEVLGVATNEPFTWTHRFPEGVGLKQVRAWATDDAGLVTVSELISFQVEPRPPPNDDFANRVPLAGTFVLAGGSLSYTTGEPGEPTPQSPFQGGSAWWSWTAPASGRAVVTSSRYLWFLGVFTGSDLTGLVAVGTTMTSATSQPSRQLTFDAVAGMEYQIACVEFSRSGETVELALFLDARELRRSRMLREGLFAFDLRTTVDRLWIIEASTNLVHWMPVAAGQCADGTLEFLDPNVAGYSMRFYRAVEDPSASAVWQFGEPGIAPARDDEPE